MRRRRPFVLLAFALALAGCKASPSSDAAHGRKIATLTGCISCHGSKLDGHLFEENAQFALAYSSNLSRILPEWSDAQIDRVLRSGRRPDGKSLWFMPTFAQRRLSPPDMRDLIAWLRSVPPSGAIHPPIRFGPLFKDALTAGFQDSADQAVQLAARQPVALGRRYEPGRYLAAIACAECHGPDLKGARNPQPGDPPDLDVAAAYSPDAFGRLLRTGIMQNGKKAELMGEEAPKRLSILTDAEVAGIRAYLLARAARR